MTEPHPEASSQRHRVHKNKTSSDPHRPAPEAAASRSAPALVLVHKPCRVMCQFTDEAGRETLRDVMDRPENAALKAVTGLYPAGRLDFDSEGLLLLTNHGPWQARVAHPRHGLTKTYLVQVEGTVTDTALHQLCTGVMLNDGPARAASARRPAQTPDIAPRDPPIRHRLSVPTDWLEITLDEGRNRQVRRMTAAVGLPTLRLIRIAVGPWRLDDLAPGEARPVPREETERWLGPARLSADPPPAGRPAWHRPSAGDHPPTRVSRTGRVTSGRPSATPPPRKPRGDGHSPR